MVDPQKSHEDRIYDIKREEALRAHDKESEFWHQVNQAAIDSGTLAIKTAFLINGGAAAAMLAFIGALVGQGRIGDGDLHSLANNLTWFAAGVAATGLSTGAAYFTNYFTAAASSSRQRIWEHPYLKPAKLKWYVLRNIFLALAVAAGIIALGLFIFGMFQVKATISSISIIRATPIGSGMPNSPQR